MMVQTQGGQLHVVDQPGDNPAFVLMHGFPDDSRIYDRLMPLLGPRRVVAFDFLGYGRSDRPPTTDPRPAPDRQQELAGVVEGLGLDGATLVAHDASGPVAVDYAMSAPDGVGRIVLMNTYYGRASMLRFPEMIWLFAEPQLAPLADAMVAEPNQLLWLLQHTARRFGTEDVENLDPAGIEATSIMPQFFGDGDRPAALPAIRAWTATLFAQLDEQDQRIASGRLADLDVPVTVLFGERDDYLNPGVADHLAGLFGDTQVRLVQKASHWPQWDQPEALARLLTGV
jgi:pimeloyl-ACP methyl ester carboxylesterase